MSTCIRLWRTQGSNEKDKRDDDVCDKAVLCICNCWHLLITCICSKLTYDLKQQLGNPPYNVFGVLALSYIQISQKILHNYRICTFLANFFQISKVAFRYVSDSARGWVHASETDTGSAAFRFFRSISTLSALMLTILLQYIHLLCQI